jgi:hypothetical protein
MPLVLFYKDSTFSDNFIASLRRDYDVECVELPPGRTDRWSINFLKWEVSREYFKDWTHILYMDVDAFIGGPLVKQEVLRSCVRPVNFAKHPDWERVIGMGDKVWGVSPQSKAYVAPEDRSSYHNAGVCLCTHEGMYELQARFAVARSLDSVMSLFGSTPYFDETYLQRFMLIDSPGEYGTLSPEWNRFCRLYSSQSFHICHMVAHGGGTGSVFHKLRHVRQRLGVVDPTFRSRFFPPEYFNTRWLMDSADRFTFLGILTALRPKNVLWVGVYAAKDLEPIRRRHPEMEVHCIDISTKMMGKTTVDEAWLHMYVGDSKELIPRLMTETSPDLVFIDGDHEYEGVLADITASATGGAVILGHDWHYPPTQAAVRHFHDTHPQWTLDVVETAPTHIFGSTYGGFFFLLPPKVDSDKI